MKTHRDLTLLFKTTLHLLFYYSALDIISSSWYPCSRIFNSLYTKRLLSFSYFCLRQLPLYYTGLSTWKTPKYWKKLLRRIIPSGIMETCSRTPNVDTVRNSAKRILRGSWTTADITDPLQDSYMKSHHAALRITSVWLNLNNRGHKALQRTSQKRRRLRNNSKLRKMNTFQDLRQCTRPWRRTKHDQVCPQSTQGN